MNAFRTYQKLAGELNYALFYALLIALPLPRFILQPIAVAWIISWVLECRFVPEGGWPALRDHIRTHWPLTLPGVLLVVYTLWEALSLLWAPDTVAGLKLIERHWPFVILVLIPLFGFNEHYQSHKMLATLFAASVASVPLYLFTYYWVWNADAVIWFNHDLLRPFEFPSFHGFTSLMKLRGFYCIILMLSICSSPLLYRHYRQTYPRWKVMVTLGIGVAVMLTGMLMTGSRTALLTLFITALFLLFVGYRKRLRWWTQLLIIVGGLSIGVSALVFNTRFSLFTSADIEHLDLALATEQNEPRFFIWKAVFDHADEYGWFGLGAGQHIPFMMNLYQEAGNELFLRMAYGPHSQYLSTWMCLGPLAVLLLLAVFVLIPRVYKGRAHYSAHAFAFLFAFSLISDDLLERMDSILILLVWMLLLYLIETTSSPIEQHPD